MNSVEPMGASAARRAPRQVEEVEMRHHQARGRHPHDEEPQRPAEILADPIEAARAIGDVLPDAITCAEAAGLSIIAQHLAKALHLARRIVASCENGA